MKTELAEKRNIAWLIANNSAFAEAYKIRRRIEKEQADNRKAMAKAIKAQESEQ